MVRSQAHPGIRPTDVLFDAPGAVPALSVGDLTELQTLPAGHYLPACKRDDELASESSDQELKAELGVADGERLMVAVYLPVEFRELDSRHEV